MKKIDIHEKFALLSPRAQELVVLIYDSPEMEAAFHDSRRRLEAALLLYDKTREWAHIIKSQREVFHLQ